MRALHGMQLPSGHIYLLQCGTLHSMNTCSSIVLLGLQLQKLPLPWTLFLPSRILGRIPAQAPGTPPPPPSSLTEVLPLLHPLLSLPPGSGIFWPFLNAYSQRCHQLSWGGQLHLAVGCLSWLDVAGARAIPGLSSKRLPCSTPTASSSLPATYTQYRNSKQ